MNETETETMAETTAKTMDGVMDVSASESQTRHPAPGTLGAVPICRHLWRKAYDTRAEAVEESRKIPTEDRKTDPVEACGSHFHVIVRRSGR